MPYELSCSARGWGSVENPLNEGDRIRIEDGVLSVDDGEVARALADEYDPLSITTDLEDETAEESEGEDLPDLSEDEWTTLGSEYDFEDVDGRSSVEKIQSAYTDLSESEQSDALAVLDGE